MQKKNISRLHYITTPCNYSYMEQIKAIVLGGGNWVQLRMPEASLKEKEQVTIEALRFCMDNGATLIIDNNVELAAKLGADGVHLDMKDMQPNKAREILGPQAILGASANSFAEVQQLHEAGLDYIHLGPHRIDPTKSTQDAPLSVEEYQSILSQCKAAGITTPIIAFGGLVPDDVKPLFDIGIHGVAFDSYLAQSEQPGALTLELLEKIGRCSSANWGKLF
ncbi:MULTISPECIES: thiamine phosphate synthase [unclassified Carboxylicivirga]|uniref:thiamine phosphate synthase n=1 Tax=Carboxylicivirga TaxID=1628153 RepID=UPI003D336256